MECTAASGQAASGPTCVSTLEIPIHLHEDYIRRTKTFRPISVGGNQSYPTGNSSNMEYVLKGNASEKGKDWMCQYFRDLIETKALSFLSM